MGASFQAKLTSKGQLTLPARMRSALNLRAGDNVRFIEDEPGRFRVEPVTSTLADLRGSIGAAECKFTTAEINAMIGESRQARGESAMPRNRKAKR